MNETEIKDQAAKSKYWFSIVQWVGGLLITILAGYGSVTYTNGAREQRIINIESAIQDLKDQNKYGREHYMTVDEMKRYMDQQTQILNRIEDNINKIRDREK